MPDEDDKMTVHAKARPTADDANRPKTVVPGSEKSNTRMQSTITDEEAREAKEKTTGSE